MIRALITRPAEDAAPLAEALRAYGVEPVIEPLLTIKPLAAALPPLDGVRALLLTSANGVRAFAACSDRRDLPVFAVGPATAETARAAGFGSVEHAGGDVDALVELVSARIKPEEGRLIHVSGSVAAGDLAGRLSALGYRVERIALYEAIPAEALSDAVKDDLAAGRLAWVLLFSPRTAATFAAVVRQAGLEAALARCTAICLSAAVAEAVAALPWRDVRVAAQPDQSALLQQVDALLAEVSPAPSPSAPPAVPASTPRAPLWPAVGAALATVLIVLGALAATVPLWRDVLLPLPVPDTPAPAAADPARLDALAARVDQLQRAIAAQPRPSAGTVSEQQLTQLQGDLTQRLGQLATELEALRSRVAALDQAEQGTAGKQAVTELGDRTGRLADQMSALQQRLTQAEQAQQQKSSDAARRAAFAVGVAELESAARTGRPFAASLRTVAGLNPDPAIAELLKPLAPLAERGVPTLDRLKHDFPDMARRAQAAQVASDYQGWMGQVMAFLQGLVTIRHTGPEVTGDDAEARLARAGAALDSDDLAGAVAALDGLPQPAARLAQPWLQQAHDRLTLDHALAQLNNRALSGVAQSGG